MSDTIFVKQPKKDKFTVLDTTCVNDPRLSWKAKGLHTYFMTLPESWQVHLNEIVRHSTDGIDSLYSAVKGLEKFHYLKKERMRSEDGRFANVCYYIYEKPYDGSPVPKVTSMLSREPQREKPHVDYPDVEKPYMEKPHVENPTLTNTDITNTNIINTELTNYESQKVSESVFVNIIKGLFGGNYPFDKNFESDVMKKYESYQLPEESLESYLKYVYERTKLGHPSKSFEGFYRILALSSSIFRDFKIIQQNQNKTEDKVCERKIVYITCPSCGKEFDEFEYYCPDCGLKIDSIKNNDEDEIKIHKTLHQLSQEERTKIDEQMDAKTKAIGRSFLTIEERKQFYRDLGIL